MGLADQIVVQDAQGWLGPRHVVYVDNSGSPKPNVGAGEQRVHRTIANALTECVDGRGDLIVVRAGHTETYSAAAGLVVNVNNVTILGLGGRTTRPKLTLDTADTVTIDITGSDVTIENFHFVAAFTDIVKGVHVTADGFTLRNCMFTEDSGNFLIAVNLAASDDDADFTTIEGCFFYQPTITCTHAIYMAKELLGVRIEGNYIVGDFVAAGGPIEAGAAEVQLAILIKDNIIFNAASDAVTCIKIAPSATNTGVMQGNSALTADTSGDTPFIGVGLGFKENYGAGVLSTASAFLYPAVDS